MNKGLLFVTALSLLAASGCIREASFPEKQEMKLSVSLTSVHARTYLGETDGSRRQVYWSEGDAVNVNGYESLPLTKEQTENGSQTAEFKLYNSTAPFRVIYPASIVDELCPDGKFSVMVPSAQEYSANSFGKGSAILYGYGEAADEPVTLHNLCAAIKVSLNNSDAVISKAVLMSNAKSAPIAGQFSIDTKTGEYTVSAGVTAVNLNITEVSLDAESGQSFYFTIPYGSYPDGFTVKFYDAENFPMECVWHPADSLVGAGKLYEFKPVDFVRGTKEILTAEDWKYIVECINKGSNEWKDAYLDSSNTIKLGADIIVDSIPQISKDFTYILDGRGHTITNTNATLPLIKTLPAGGVVRNLTIAGKMRGIETQGYVEASAFVRNLTGGTIENCTNEMLFDIDENVNVIFGTFVRDAKAGVMRNCVNNAEVNVKMDVTGLTSGDAKSFGGGLIAGCSGPSGVIEIDRCVNNGAVSVSLTRGSKGGISRAGFGGIVGYAYGCTIDKYPKMTGCVNNGNILLSADEVSAPIKAQASIGGIIGLAAYLSKTGVSCKQETGYPLSYSSIGPITSDSHCYVYLEDCKNTAVIRNNATSSCDSREYDVKIYTGGLAGTIVGKRENHAKIINCVNTGEVIPYSVPMGVGLKPYSRAAICGVCGGFLGLGGYIDIEGGTMDASVGTAETHSFAVAGVMGLAMSKFSISDLNVKARISRVAGSDISKDDHALVVTNNTSKYSLTDYYDKTTVLYTGNDTDLTGSLIKDCKISGSFFVSSVSYKSDPVYPSGSPVEVTEAEILSGQKIVSASYTQGGITLENNIYWSK